MQAQERAIIGILTESIRYEIPPYQRPYSWHKENVQQLLEDVWEAYNAGDPEYFIGSLITIEREHGRLYDVVDGQQRLTTLNLIFARLRDHIADKAAKAELGKRILPCNVLTGEAETPRLLLRKKDQSFFRQYVLDSKPIPANALPNLDAPQQRLAENLAAVDEFCQGKSEQVLKLFANYILTKVYVVFVNTDSLRSAYRLFNVLNARGLALSNADLIKNTLFSILGTGPDRSAELEERWLQLEEELTLERMDTFLAHHRAAATATQPRLSLHEEFGTLIRATSTGPFEFLDRLIASAENYTRIVDGDFPEPASKRPLLALKRVEYNEWIPPLLAYLNQPVPGITEAEFITLLEKITMQNWVRRLGRAARLTVYFQLISAIRGGKSADEVREIFRKNARNEEFFTLLGGDVYGKPFDHAVLLRLEEAAQDDSVTMSYGGRLTIEHVLPQALKDQYWKERFDQTQHAAWLNRLGNLAMLCGHKNYKAKYFAFDRKKAIYNERGKKVSFTLTQEVCALPEWTEDTIKARHTRMLDLARETWKLE